MLWDIFCKVIDNHGDVGVCWRLAADLAGRGQSVRLWLDDPSVLTWMAPGGQTDVQVLPWEDSGGVTASGHVVIEAFGCELGDRFVATMARSQGAACRPPVWVNLEYLSAETFVQRNHALPSPVLQGPGAGLTKHFFYPGFTRGTGGLLREPGLASRQSCFDRQAWTQAQGLTPSAGRTVSLFCYEPSGLPALLAGFARGPQPTRLLVTAGRARHAVEAAMGSQETRGPGWNRSGLLTVHWLTLLSQNDFDHLLWASDLNFVRGEDSLVRALWAGQPLVWQPYPQHDNAHHAKLAAFLDWLQAPASLRRFHRGWSGIEPALPGIDPGGWSDCIADARTRLLAQDDLTTQLMRFVDHRIWESP